MTRFFDLLLKRDLPWKVTHLVVSLGFSLSGIFITLSPIQLIPLLLSFLGIFIVLIFSNTYEKFKNFNKLRIAKIPTFSKEILHKHLFLFKTIAGIYTLLIWVLGSFYSALIYLSILLYLYLEAHDFHIKKRWIQYPLFQSLLRNLVWLPITLFAASMGTLKTTPSLEIFSLFMLVFGACFVYDICHQLNPHIHPILGGYIHFYGFRRSFEFSVFFLVCSAIGAVHLKLEWVLFPVEFSAMLCLALLFFRPNMFHIPQIASTLSLVIHSWILVLGD